MTLCIYSKRQILCSIILLLPAVVAPLYAGEDIEIIPDMVYGHKHGMALTMDVYRPDPCNGIGILFMVSGGWHSAWAPPEKTMGLFKPLLDKKFTVLAVRHGSSPKYIVPEIVKDVQRSVRYVKLHAKELGVDPNQLGVCGFSAGGHLSLILGTMSDDGDPDSKDEVMRVNNRVAAVVAYCPPTDLRPLVGEDSPYPKHFPALRFDPNDVNQVSPLLYASSDDPPVLMIHGDKDTLVPIWHSKKMCKALKDKGVESELMVIEGAGHGFTGEDGKRANNAWVAWFEKHLLLKKIKNKH
ncbi:MAG: alpha/beta hydrolase [Planctomycetota bacterium]|nr:MAG: alpha/beta hydrolase [Planctomycetota bacterium]